MVTAFSLPVSAQSSAASGLVELDGTRLTIDEVVQVARSGARAVLAPGADEAIARGELALRAHVAAGATIYGLTTGVGALDGHVLSPLPGAENRAFQRHLLLSHAAGT
ncbi:MAG TPA: aromatic amino acid lyase, partial [Polyangiaceae bacterium]|nr:aromatic amino acid lyase [Polyangiaceae bacterium]